MALYLSFTDPQNL